MRWFWIDRFKTFESGRRAVATKNISLAEEQMDSYMYASVMPIMPPTLIIEGIAQTGGLLVGEHNQFLERVVLAKVAKAVFHQPAVAGDTLTYTAVVESIESSGAICKCTSHIGDSLQADVELIFAHLDDTRFKGVDLFEPTDFLRMLRMLKLFDVGVDANGQRLQIPDHLVVAEQEYMAQSD